MKSYYFGLLKKLSWGVFFASFFLAILFFGFLSYTENKNLQQSEDIVFGVSFSPIYAQKLGLNWQTVYLDILNNLKVKRLRLTSNWDLIEVSEGDYSFKDLDFMLSEAEKSGAKVLMVVGVKQPRWPECHIPGWAKNLSIKDRQRVVLKFVSKTVERYRDNPAIWGWQVENEPLFPFGYGCDPADRDFLEIEVSLVRNLDPTRPIIISDSGETRPWRTPMQLSDIFGTTLYRTVHDKYLGHINIPLLPSYYHFKSILARKLFAHNNLKTIIVELQAEPWAGESLQIIPIDKQIQLFSKEKFQDHIEFAKKTGFKEAYLWGTEWWYFMDKNGHPEYLEYARILFN